MTVDLNPQDSYEIIMEAVVARGGKEDSRAIWRAINKVRSTDYIGGEPGEKEWPEADQNLILDVALNYQWDMPDAGRTLERRSPYLPKKLTSYGVLSLLFAQDDRLSVGVERTDTAVTRLRNLSKSASVFRFVVPSVAAGAQAKTQDGKLSGRCKKNFPTRKYLVLDLDWTERDKHGQATHWVPMIRELSRYGMTPLQAQAGIALHLIDLGLPIVMVVYSGGKSLHIWIRTNGESEAVGSPLYRWMRYFAELGSDISLFRHNAQFVRMPLATRDNGSLQSVHYLNHFN